MMKTFGKDLNETDPPNMMQSESECKLQGETGIYNINKVYLIGFIITHVHCNLRNFLKYLLIYNRRIGLID